MIRECNEHDFEIIHDIINEAATAYQGVIPVDCWKEPYMPMDELNHEINLGVVFWGYEEDGQLIGVMGIQPVLDVVLIRHAYVRTAKRNGGIGGKLLTHLCGQTTRPVLIGTWAAAVWAIGFYQKHGFRLIEEKEEKERLLRKYWTISRRQLETSVVLGDRVWFELSSKSSRGVEL